MKTQTAAKFKPKTTDFTYFKVHPQAGITYAFKYEREARHYARTHNCTYYEAIYAPGIRDLIFIL